MVAAAEMKAAGHGLPVSAGTGPAGGSPRHQVAELPEGFWYSAKRRLLGPPSAALPRRLTGTVTKARSA
jgi:hypothetical protein